MKIQRIKSSTTKMLLCTVLMLSFFASCFYIPFAEVETSGLENFSVYDSSVGLTAYLLPSEDFLQRFSCSDGTYHYYGNGQIYRALEKTIVSLTYDEETYDVAKLYCQEKMHLSAENRTTHGDYVLIENLSYAKAYSALENGVNQDFPYQFTIFGYNDKKNELIFLGFYCSVERFEEVDAVFDQGWDVFLETYYSESGI